MKIKIWINWAYLIDSVADGLTNLGLEIESVDKIDNPSHCCGAITGTIDKNKINELWRHRGIMCIKDF